MKKQLFGVLCSATLLLTACGGADKEIRSIKPLSLSEVSGSRIATLTKQEQEDLISSYGLSKGVLDDKALIKISEADMRGVKQTIAGVDEVLKGQMIKKPDGTKYIPDEFAQFILLEMAKTPYTWKRTNVKPLGMDAKSRMYFVDVEYKTTDKPKKVIGDSSIVRGSKGEETLKATRFQDYVTYMTAKNSNSPSVQTLLTKFTQRWGSVGSILEEQQGKTLLERVRQEKTGFIGSTTYSGLIEDPTMTNAATMTLRYVLKYRYNLGEEMSLSVDAVYVKDYNLEGKEKFVDMEENNDVMVKQSLDLVRPYIKDTLRSYNRAVEQTNHIGLNSLYDNYAKYDKYFIELNKTQYTNYGAYAFKVLEREGEQVKVLVEKEIKQRARGTNTSMPAYRDKYIYTMVLSNQDKILIKNSYLLERVLVQEPTSIISSIDKTTSDEIIHSSKKFTEANEKAVMQALKDFLQVVHLQDTNSSTFASLVDMGISDTTMSKIIDYTTNIGTNEMKVNYIKNWNTKSNVYVSIDLREIFMLDQYNLDTESTIEFVNRNGQWYVVNYDRKLVVKTEKGKLAEMKGVLTKNTPEGSVDLVYDEKTGIVKEVKGEQQGSSEAVEERLNKEDK